MDHMTALSPAQLEERRQAARDRWRQYHAHHAGVVAAGAAVGGAAGFGVGAAVRRRRVAVQHAEEATRAAIEAKADHQRAAYADAAERLRQGLRDKTFRTGAPRALRFIAAEHGKDLREHMTQHAEPFPDPETGETHWASADAAGERKIRETIAGLHARAADIERNAREAVHGKRRGFIATPEKESFQRERRGALKLHMSDATRQHLKQEMETPYEGNLLHEHGIHSEGDLRDRLVGMDPALRRTFIRHLREHLSLGPIKLHRPKATETVRNATRLVPPNPRVRLKRSYPTPKDRTALRREFGQHLNIRESFWRGRHEMRLREALEAHQPKLDEAIAAAARWAPRSLRRLGLVGAGTALGAGAAYAALRAREHVISKRAPDRDDISELAKAARRRKADETTEDQAKRMESTAKSVEDRLARNIAGAFRDWKDRATDDAVGAADLGGGLLDQLSLPLDEAMKPLDEAVRAGISGPPAADHGAPASPGPDAHVVRFAFDAAGPDEAAFVRRYRFARVKDITDEQRRQIRATILDGILHGNSPQAIAHKVRDSIGLTAYQARVVANFRAALSGPRPAAKALTYALRDHRFDASIEKAIRAKQPLDQAHVDKMVDAYTRRMLAYRAMTIARTESIGAANNSHAQWIKAQLDAHPEMTCVKTWMATLDDRTRPDHRGLHRHTVIGYETPFIAPSGEQIRWCHDPKAAADQIINCRCICIFHLVPRENVARAGTTAISHPFPQFWSGPAPRRESVNA